MPRTSTTGKSSSGKSKPTPNRARRTSPGSRTAPTASRKPAGSPIALPGEKQVKPRGKTVAVKPVDVTAEAKRPTPKRALDRRRNVEPGGPVGDNSGGSVRGGR